MEIIGPEALQYGAFSLLAFVLAYVLKQQHDLSNFVQELIRENLKETREIAKASVAAQERMVSALDKFEEAIDSSEEATQKVANTLEVLCARLERFTNRRSDNDE